MTAWPRCTKNTAKAVVAFLLRIPITRRRLYREEELRKNKLSAREAFDKKFLGDLEYYIHTEEKEWMARAMAAFDDQQRKIEAGEYDLEIDLSPEDIARLACVTLHARKTFFAELFKLVPFVRIKKSGQPQKKKNADGSVTKTFSGFFDIRLDADEQTINQLN